MNQVMARYWVGVVSRQHVEKGKQGRFAQLGHGKRAPLARLSEGDYLIYYSPKQTMEGKDPYQCFTAIGMVEGELTQVELASDFSPYRRSVKYLPSKDASIRPLIPELSFIRDKQHWGAVFRFGLVEISGSDFRKIAKAMGVKLGIKEST